MDILQGALNVLGAASLVLLFLLIVGFAGALVLALVGVFVLTFADIFNREDIAISKLIWAVAVLAVPGMGMILYWLTRPKSYDPETALMHRTASAHVEEASTSMRQAA